MTDSPLSHHGVKGMHWGVRKEQDTGSSGQSSTVQVESGIHSGTKNAAVKVSGLIRDRYGYDIRDVKLLGPGHPEYPSTMAYVENNKLNSGRNAGTIFIQGHDLSKDLKATEQMGWLAPGTGNTLGLLTHESAHSIFHANQKMGIGLLGPKLRGGNIDARNKALRAAFKTSRQDKQNLWNISGYARNAGVREELEAELFNQYHWATNPPRSVKVWGETLHRELGVDATPFKEVKSRG